uniref:G2/mitotic-specific cyclin-B2 n=1 Tax=Periophthalmus magnuspinnatus TaxID=409849 RepID=A0A3B4AFG0_9GOBI
MSSLGLSERGLVLQFCGSKRSSLRDGLCPPRKPPGDEPWKFCLPLFEVPLNSLIVHFHVFFLQLNAEARCKLVSWLIPVHQHLSLSFECLCLTVNIMDRFLASTPVAADCFQLLGVTALLLASKQVEVCSPRISDLLSLCCDAFTKEQLCNLECLILVNLNFRLCAPTLAFFLDCYVNLKSGKAAATLEKNCDTIRTNHCNKLAQKLCELSLADYAFNKYPASLTARCSLQMATEIVQAAQQPLRRSHSLETAPRV